MDPSNETISITRTQSKEYKNKRDTFIDVAVPSYQLELPHDFPLERAPWDDASSEQTKVPTSSTDELSIESNNVEKRGDTASDAVGDFPQGLQLAMIVLAVILSFFLVSLDMTIVATAIPRITDEFHGIADVSWYSSVFFMTTAGFQSTWGKAYKYFPLKTTFLASITVFELGSLLCGAAPTSLALIIGRAITGIGGAGIGSGCYTIIGFSADPKKRPLFTGLVGASYGIASALGPLLGGLLSDKASWRWCFYINLPIGAISILAIVRFFKSPAAANPQAASWMEKIVQMDPLGSSLMMSAVVSLILALQKGGQTDSWGSPKVIGLLVSAGVLMVLFAVWESFQGERAMIVPRLFRRRVIFFSFMFLALFAGGYYTLIYILPLYFQAIDGTSPIESGVRNLPLIIAVSIASILSGSLVSSTGFAAPLMPIGAATATVAAGLLFTLDIGTEPIKWVMYQVLAGIGFGIAIQVPMIISQSSIDLSDLASITALMMFSQTTGAAVLVSAAQAAFGNVLLQEAQMTAPDIKPEALIMTGVGSLRQVFRPDQLAGILVAYMRGLKITFAIVIGAVVLAFSMSTYVPWKRLGHGSKKEVAAEEV
ncbi:efflux pump antibiotic resistance [Colletotrichum karsti]|uniref:Efflux pump antibiotic resistance n=1 Tax=Colletotrichum karsti TaxID=1095194 RepID=A0A9P6IFA8_9PEZI|nr:efflux pump antibiotic resistance [Colletotrichum karsti]KAF9881763.1 efflux pump antibiotic resistance [Colletotrichum karsti]